MNNASTSSLRLRDRLAGQHLLVTGATGFLGKVFVEKLLRSVDTIASLTLLIRPGSDGTPPAERASREVLGSSIFNRLRASLGDRLEELWNQKVRVVAGDITKERLGLTPAVYAELTQRLTLIVNNAATVTFDEQLDLALQMNTLGPSRLLQLSHDCGNIPFMQVSTCYVCGMSSGRVAEAFMIPPAAEKTLPRRENGAVDLERLVNDMLAEAGALRERQAGDPEACRQRLIEAGLRHANAHGWNDTYTFTKWLGEQLLARDRGQTPLVIFRPAIIEGSFDEPTPGWIDGLRMADPIIAAYGRGKLQQFPGQHDVPIDLIPVDFVANAMIATLLSGGERDLPIYQCASSGRRPLRLGELAQAVETAFRQEPMNDDNGEPVRPPPLKLVSTELFVKRWEGKLRLLSRIKRLCEKFRAGRERARKLAAQIRQIEQLLYFAKIYAPYTRLDCRFDDDRLHRVFAGLAPADQEEFPFDTGRIDWQDYIVNRHVPGLRNYVLAAGLEPSLRILGLQPALAAEPAVPDIFRNPHIYVMFDRIVERFPHKPAFQVRREGRWIRYTYAEARRATGTIMRRFLERDLRPGDRVVLAAESSPEWALTYLAIQRAGMTAVALDPQLSPADTWAAARFAAAKLICASPGTYPQLAEHRGDGDPDILRLGEPFVPPPGASREPEPPAVELNSRAIASILFTSGTTVSPKAVLLAHENFVNNVWDFQRMHPRPANEEFLSVLPMYHAFEFTGGFLFPLSLGATITYINQVKGPEILAAMQATGTTIMLAVPRLLQAFHHSITDNVNAKGAVVKAGFGLCGVLSDWLGPAAARKLFASVHRHFGGRLKTMVVGGSALAPELFNFFTRLGFEVFEGYGMTETAPVLTLNPPGGSRANSAGKPLASVELRLHHVGADGVGEIRVRGPNVMSGYLNNPEADAAAFAAGWFQTGDLGRLDADGYLYLTGRTKDIIVTSAGKNVYPCEVELKYSELPWVKEFCVLGMPAEPGPGEAVHAVAVLDREQAAGMERAAIEDAIREAAANISPALPSYQRIAKLHFWERELPKTTTFKPKKNQIRELLLTAGGAQPAGGRSPAGAPGAAPPPPPTGDPQEPFAVARAILAKHCRIPADGIRRELHLLLDLGIDSIGKIDVLCAVEAAFDIQIDDDAAAGILRVADLLRLIGDRKPVKGARPQRTWRQWLAGGARADRGNGRVSPLLLPLRWSVRGGVRLFMHTYIRVHGRGREHIPASGGFILAANHTSHLDSPAVLQAAGGRRRVWTTGAEDYFFNTSLKRFVFGKLFDTIAVDRRQDGLQGLRRCSETLQRGDGVLIFPEGTRSPTGKMDGFKVGAAVLALERQVPIIPVHIAGAHALLPKGKRLARPGAVTVTFGEPLRPPPPDAAADHQTVFRELTQRVEAAVAALGAP